MLVFECPKANPRPAGEGRVRGQQLAQKSKSALGRGDDLFAVKNLFPYFPISLFPKSVTNSFTSPKAAFTLAEVLITLGIIGVVAAITIPGLMTTYKAHQLRSQFLKSYSVIQQVFKQMEADDISMDPTTFNGGKMYDVFKNYLTGVTECGTSQNSSNKKFKPCYDYTDTSLYYKNLNGAAVPARFFDDGQLVLPDGSLVMFENPNTSGTFYVWVQVDLNGFNNPPNRWGYDLFTFEFMEGELRTMGDAGTNFSNQNTYCNPASSHSYNGIACASKAKTNTTYFKDVVKKYK